MTSKSWLGSLSCFTRTKRERHNITPYSESHRVGVRRSQLRVMGYFVNPAKLHEVGRFY